MPNCPDLNEDAPVNLALNDDVIIIGKVTHVEPGNPCLLTVQVTQGGSSVNLVFRSTELVKGENDGITITGVVSGDTG